MDYASKKARDIEGNPRVSVHFYWPAMDRQVRVSGLARKLGAAETTQILIGVGTPDSHDVHDHPSAPANS